MLTAMEEEAFLILLHNTITNLWFRLLPAGGRRTARTKREFYPLKNTELIPAGIIFKKIFFYNCDFNMRLLGHQSSVVGLQKCS